MCWSDTSVALERIMRMGRLQKINHFPGMLELVRKAGTARNLNKMLKACGKDYKFFPKTFMLPADYTQLKAEWAPGQNHGNKTFIVKPSAGCQGKGIYLTRKLDEIDPQDNSVVQRYLHRPHLLEGYKYDLRIYVLLSSLQPLRIFIFREGLVRVCTEKYQPVEKNLENVQMHLTNYAINKDSETFVQPEGMEDHEQEGAHKRTITSLMNTLRAEGHDVDRLWKDIGEVCVKTIISVQPHLEHTYFTCRQRSDDPGFGCFELLGFDIMMDYKLRPSLLEINHSPSFTCDSPMDTAVKTAVIRGTMEMISFSREEYKLIKRCPARLTPELREKLVRIRAEYELAHCDRLGFDILYAADRPDMDDPEVAALMAHYDGLLEIAAHLYSDIAAAAFKAAGISAKSSGAVPGAAGAGPSHAIARNARPAAGGGAAVAARARESVSHSAPLTSPRANSARRMRDAPKSAGTRSPVRTGRAASEAGYSSSSSHHHQPGSAAKGATKPHVAAKGGAGHISSSVLAQLANLQSLSPRILEKMSADMSGRSDRSASGLSNGLPSQRSAGSSSTPFRVSSYGHHSRSPLNPQQA
ncbi:tubulin-tyrosine ligase family protein [Chrysochromulina tobinii]|uniref:Tubulin-tyrosine ligase family protein n=1 Tax=Chrysochromulina tobinii TaxID=1460289 RepID=A0A0M0J5B5_9EUKA|nr:tubulin-tyrosine ligase family protein [Chrysochromulina tobinii]|eukprot:KOO21403.1 tubulin-tyrosine ligase family protein [Chrysochromulina sp. CCMP291]